MKVYIVWYDNGESYEDNVQCIEKVFQTYEAAAEYLDDNFERRNGITWDSNRREFVDSFVWEYPDFTCSMGNMEDCEECPKYDEIMDDETGYCCDECEQRFMSYMDKYASWTIQEWEAE